MDGSLVLGIISMVLTASNIWQFIFYRKEKRKYEAETLKTEEEATQAGFTNYKERLDYFFEVNNKIVEANMNLREENFEFRQKIKEYEYRFERYERKFQGMQRVIDENIKKSNDLASKISEISVRAAYAEDKICLNTGCVKRVPTLGTFNKKEDESK